MQPHGVEVITAVQLHSKKFEFRFCGGSNLVRGVPEIRNCEDLWSRLEIRLKCLSPVNHTTKIIHHDQYQQKSETFYTFTPNKYCAYLLNVE